MATIEPTVVDKDNGTTKIVTWTLPAQGDDGAPVEFTTHGDRCVQVTGDGSARADIQGSNDGVVWDPLSSVNSVNLIGTTALQEVHQISQVPLYIRPVNTVLSAGVCIVTIVMRRNNQSRQ